MKKIKDLGDLNQKIILLRVDLNVPLQNSKVLDATRIKKVIPTISHLLSENAKIIILTHVGRPKGKKIIELSLKPICEYLKDELDVKIKLITENLNNLNKSNIFSNNDEKIILLENIRFYPEEENDDIEFAKKLASLGDIYVNEAFSCSHRAHASVSKITKFIPSYGGLHLSNEIDALYQITHNIEKPVSCIIGGSKISTKIKVITNLAKKYDNIIVVGAMANNFVKYNNHNIGKSVFEKNSGLIVKKIYESAKFNNCKIIYPTDFLVGKNLNDFSNNRKINEIENDDIILDIGLETIKSIKNIINNSKTILWNGPAGYFENENFAAGSYEIAKEISAKTKNSKLFSVIGGGDTVAVLNKLKLINNFSFVSTAGGAFLEYLEGKELPGIKSLN